MLCGIFLLCCVLFCSSCEIEQYSVDSETNIVYKTIENNRLELDMLYPTNRLYRKNPVVFLLHGGGWMSGSRQTVTQEFGDTIDMLRENGFIVIPVSYRLLDGETLFYKDCIRDCIDAVKWIVEHQKEYEIDTAKMGVMGYSAGAHLSLMTAYAKDNANFSEKYTANQYAYTLKFCVELSSPATFSLFDESLGSEALEFYQRYLFDFDSPTLPQDMEEASPSSYLKKASNKTALLLINGTADTIIPIIHADTLYKMATDAKLPVDYWRLENTTHQYAQYDFSQPESISFPTLNQQIAQYIIDCCKQ